MILACVVALAVGVLAGWLLRARRGRSVADRSVQDGGARAVQRPRPADRSPLTPSAVEILDALRSLVVVVDPSDRVVKSSAASNALGLVRDSELAHPPLRQLVRDVRRDGEEREVELEVARGPLGGSRLTLGVRVAALSDQYVLLLVEDRTQSRRVEETRRDFVVNVSHELKTPVSGLTLLAEAMDDARDDPDAVHRFAGRMHQETARLSRLVQEIVQLSRLQVADTLSDPVLVDVRDSVCEAVDHLRLLAEGRRIRISSPLRGDGPPARVYGDGNLITTAVRNLVENAINYSEPDTTVAITVQTDGDLVSVVVKDQGSGIPRAEQDRIFERFYRVDAARSRSTGGTGLGLAIVKHVCANHGGEVQVWSEEGQGSTFTMRLPAADSRTAPPASPVAASSIPAAVPGSAASR